MQLALIILDFLTAALGFANAILRLTSFRGDTWGIVWVIGWLIFGAVWLLTGILNLKKYIQEKKQTRETGDTNG